jgi:hypothetical protein
MSDDEWGVAALRGGSMQQEMRLRQQLVILGRREASWTFNVGETPE